MLAQLGRFSSLVTLVPKSGLQFLDGGIDADGMKMSKAFWERPDSSGLSLASLEADSDGVQRVADGTAAPEGQSYSINVRKALDMLGDAWLPLPIFRVRGVSPSGRPQFAAGPGNWARLRIKALDQPDDDGNTHRMVVAFDTALAVHREGRPYLAPAPLDVQSGREFLLASELEDISWFLAEPWVSESLREAFDAALIRRRGGRRPSANDNPFLIEHCAAYLVVLAALAKAEAVPRIRFIDTESTPVRFAPVDVDLVLDVGNSRTCGLLVEATRPIDLNNSHPLEIRDLSRPEHVYTDPFPSRLEFARVSFGNDMLSRRSGRTNAFTWPLVARVGWEAARLSYLSQGTEGNTGLNSPKRYLWDWTTPQNREWRFNAATTPDGFEAPVSTGTYVQHLTERGDLRTGDDLPAVSARFSRSSLMTLFIAEILLHALTQINAPAHRHQRAHADVPRRLRRLILTMPTAMPLPDRKQFKKRVSEARILVWRLLDLDEAQAPEEMLQWDEATGTQTVFIYNEVMTNFRGDHAAFFSSASRSRRGETGQDLRIASIDIGGGTSDLIITRYGLVDDKSIEPTEEFREGFNIAGDDILCAVIERHVLPTLADAMTSSGVRDPVILMASLFGENRGGQSEIERTLRRQFANQIAVPLGLRLIAAYEDYDPLRGSDVAPLHWNRVLVDDNTPTPRLVQWVERHVADAGGENFRLLDLVGDINLPAIDTTVRRAIEGVLADLCEVSGLYDCDFLLLSGRPSRMPGVLSTILAKLPVPADRVLCMHDYEVGNWYPFRDVHGNLGDPKTTAAVGATVAALSEGYLENFHMSSRNLTMRSTARFIGEMEASGQIKQARVFFGDIDLDDAKRIIPPHTFSFYAPMFIGFRQLDVERWPATPVYRLDFTNPQEARRRPLPLRVTIERLPDEEDRDFKIFEVTEVSDADGNSGRGLVTLRPQTLKDEHGYWVDTGILRTPR